MWQNVSRSKFETAAGLTCNFRKPKVFLFGDVGTIIW